jgi:hypothetical protein
VALYHSKITTKMTNSLVDTLKGLKTDPTLVTQLYKQLFESTYYVLVRSGTEKDLTQMEFLTYDTKDEVRELPLFTNEKFILNNLSQSALIIKIYGQSFWKKMLDIIETGKCEAAIDPGQVHGIRLTKEMILGMLVNYGKMNNTT